MNKIKSPTQFEERVYKITRLVPKGKVSTYKEIAIALNSSPRAVGNALGKNPYAPEVPCHRIIKSDGSIGGFNRTTDKSQTSRKVKLLESEGIVIKENKIVDKNKIVKINIK